MIQTRAATLTDLDEIHRIELECFGKTGVPLPQLRWVLENQGEKPSLFFAVALGSDDPTLQGFICWKAVKNEALDHFEILDLGVGNNFRNQKVEEVLIEHLVEAAKVATTRGLTVMVPGANLEAMQFYARMGFFPKEQVDNIFSGDRAEILTRRIG